MRRFVDVPIPLAACFLAAACGKADFSGTYSGTMAGSRNGVSFNQAITMVLNQSDTQLGGSFNTVSTSVPDGTVTATVSGSTLVNLTLTYNSTNICPQTYTGSGSLKDNVISAVITGTANCGTVNIDLTAAKQ